MSFSAYLTKQRNRYSQELIDSRKYKFLSALTLQTHIEPLCQKYVHGRVLDAGARRLNAKSIFFLKIFRGLDKALGDFPCQRSMPLIWLQKNHH